MGEREERQADAVLNLMKLHNQANTPEKKEEIRELIKDTTSPDWPNNIK